MLKKEFYILYYKKELKNERFKISKVEYDDIIINQ